MDKIIRFLVCLHVCFLLLSSTDARGLPYPAMFQQGSGGSCENAGHRDGCCLGSISACAVLKNNRFCYCDERCHAAGECCSDIFSIGCRATTCANAGLPLGCCVWTPWSTCRTNGGCYCDKDCLYFTDCCSDVPSTLQCPVPEESDMMSRLQIQQWPLESYIKQLRGAIQNRMKEDGELMAEKLIAMRLRAGSQQTKQRRRPFSTSE